MLVLGRIEKEHEIELEFTTRPLTVAGEIVKIPGEVKLHDPS